MSSICPYPGLRPFNENESIFFKGREEHIDKIIHQLQEKKYLMVTGASGDGKSSLIYAGLIPRSRAGFFKARFNNWIIADLKPERSPLTNLALAITEHLNLKNAQAIEKELSYGFSSLIKVYKESSFFLDYESEKYLNADFDEKQNLKNKSANLLILIDQFEELFTNSENFNKGKPSIQAITLINLIIETTKIAAKENIPIYIVSTMRSDYVGDCAVFKGLPELMVYSQFFVPRLKRQEIQRAIVEPSKLSGNKINNRLVERLINELGDGQDQLPILQHALNRIWKAHNDDGFAEMDLLHYAKVGGISSDLLPTEHKEIFSTWYKNQPAFKQSAEWKNQPAGLTNVLNAHARELFETSVSKNINEATNRAEVEELLKKIFTCLTKINDNRAVRNRLSVAEIKNIIGNTISTKQIENLINIYRDSDNTLLRPFITSEKESLSLNDNDIIDITHESLIRNWTELTEWTKKEQENILIINDLTKQLERWVNSHQSKDFLLTTGSVNFFNSWMETIKPNPHLIAKYNLSNHSKQQKLEEATEFLQTTTIYIEASQFNIKRRQKILRVVASIILVVLLGFTYWAITERNKAVAQQKIADKKTAEALLYGKYAVDAKQDAEKTRDSAVKLKEVALQNEKAALIAKQQAEKSKQEAIQSKLNAEAQKVIAQNQTAVAKTEKSNAEKEQQKAEQQKIKAEQSELKSQKLKLLSIAQNLTLKSTLYKKNKQLMGQLAVQAYNFNKENGGLAEDPIIYEGLKNAYAALDSNKHSVIANSSLEIRTITEINNNLISADLDGQVFSQDYTSLPKSKKRVAQLNYISPINTLYFNQQTNYLISAHDNFAVCIWDIKNRLNAVTSKENFKEYLGHRGLVRTVVFSDDASLMATSGKDSLILIHDIKQKIGSPLFAFKASAGVKSISFVNNGKAIVSAQNDGSITFWDLDNLNKPLQLYKSNQSKPLCLANYKLKNVLLAGLSDGTLLAINLNLKDASNSKIKEYKVHITAIENIIFNSNYSMVATSATDKSIKFYNFQSYFQNNSLIGSFTEIKDHNSKVKSLFFTKEDKLVASCEDKTIRIWETSTTILAEKICNLLKTNMSEMDWKLNVGEDIPYQKTCIALP
ncbi:MAG: hypothetical protein SFY56_15795 [Bacteroidota bacterium]|nr:hypothetical protein [Bacteroidota bacterium]